MSLNDQYGDGGIVSNDRYRAGFVRSRLNYLLGVLLAGALIASACSSDDEDSSSESPAQSESTVANEDEPQRGGSLVMAMEGALPSFLPSATAASGLTARLAVYDTLTKRDDNGEYQPYLAESVEGNADGTEWTVRVRAGVKFHDGTPLNSAALKRGFDGYLKGPRSALLPNLQDVTMEVVDDMTVKYLVQPGHFSIPALLAGPVGMPFSPDAADSLGADYAFKPAGTGPFKVVSASPGADIVMERNPEYWQTGLPYLDSITFRALPDEEARALSLEAGDVQAAESLRLNAMPVVFESLEGVAVYPGLATTLSGTLLNTTKAPTDDVRVRQAFAHALDTEQLVAVVAGEFADQVEIMTQLVSKESPYYSEQAADEYPKYDPEEARALLDEYISDPSRSDGKSPGSPVALEYSCTNVPSLQEQALVMSSMLGDVGFEVSIVPKEQIVQFQDAVAGNYQVACLRMGIDDPFLTIRGSYGDPQTTPGNTTNYYNRDVAAIIDALRVADTQEKQAVEVEKFSLLGARDVFHTFTGLDTPVLAALENFHGFDQSSFPDGGSAAVLLQGYPEWARVWTEG